MSDNNNYELNNFESLQIGLASTEKISELVLRRGYETRNYKLQNPQAGERRTVLREDLRTDKGLGMSLRKIQENKI